MVTDASQHLDVRAPFTEAHVTLIEGDQRSGKTNTAVARVVDSYFKDCVRIYCLVKFNINCIVVSYDTNTRRAKIKYKGEMKLLHMPSDYKLVSPMRIFCNFHIFGIPTVFCPSFNQTMKWLRQGLIVNGWLVIDEAYVGINARESMSILSKELLKQSFQYGKMQLDVIIITPMARLIDWSARTMPTERIVCSYDKNTKMISLTIKRKGQKGTSEVSYYAPQYWKHFWTNERITA